jgi:Zn-dependent protease
MQFGNFSALGLKLAGEMLLAVLVGMSLREWARATVAARLKDPTPRLWGRVTFNPRSWFDPFGSGLVPALIAILWSVGSLTTAVAYGKPAPVDPSYFRNQTRDSILVSAAGPAVNLAAAIVAGVVLRLASPSDSLVPTGALVQALAVFAWTNCSLFVFHLLPIPGLDGARMLALALPPHAREVYRNADRYLPLFVLLLMFVLTTLLLGLFKGLTGALCDATAGANCIGVMVASG